MIPSYTASSFSSVFKLSYMSLHVKGKMIRTTERSLTHGAFERSMTRVFPIMSSQLVRSSKSPAASSPIAMIWLFTCRTNRNESKQVIYCVMMYMTLFRASNIQTTATVTTLLSKCKWNQNDFGSTLNTEKIYAIIRLSAISIHKSFQQKMNWHWLGIWLRLFLFSKVQ